MKTTLQNQLGELKKFYTIIATKKSNDKRICYDYDRFILERPELKEFLNRELSFLSKNPFYNWKTKIYCYMNGIKTEEQLPHCKNCNKLIVQNVVNFSIGFKRKFCSKSCSSQDHSFFGSKEFHRMKVHPLYEKIMKTDVILMHTFDEFADLHHGKKIEGRKGLRYDSILTWKCKKCGNVFQSKINMNFYKKFGYQNYARCLVCHPFTFTGKSCQEMELLDYVKSIYTGTIVSGDRTQIRVGRNPSEIDIWLPELRLGIEYNGLFWHSNRRRMHKKNHKHNENGKKRPEHRRVMNHILKNYAAEDLGIKLVQIWEQEWLYDNEKIKKLIRDIIFNRVDFSTYAILPNRSLIRVPRDKFNLVYKVKGYRLVGTVKPFITKLKFMHGKTPEHFSYKHCGYLLYLAEGVDEKSEEIQQKISVELKYGRRHTFENISLLQGREEVH